MKKLTVLMCSWRSPGILRPCLDSLKKSFSEDAEIIVVLNDGDGESVEILLEHGIQFIKTNQNYGALAVDLAASLVQSEYVALLNDDMLFHKAWDSDLIDIISQTYPSSASCHLVEPQFTNNPAVLVDDLGDFRFASKKFIENQRQGKYRRTPFVAYSHPVMVKTEDYFKVGGYSDRMDFNWFPGYSLDHFFAWRLWKVHEGKFRMFASGDSCVYHGMSMTMEKLPVDQKKHDGVEYFRTRTGMTIDEFRSAIHNNQPWTKESINGRGDRI